MTNPAQQARNKAQSKWPGASVYNRGRSWIRHQHPTEPNRFMLDTQIGPMHYGPNNDQEIDTSWQPTTGAWQYEMTTNNFQTYARNLFNAGDIFEFQKDGHSLRFDPQSINWVDENHSQHHISTKHSVFAVVDDDTLRFPDAYGPGRHFQYQNQTSRLQKLITIDAPTDLPAPTLQGSEIWLEVQFSLSLSSGIKFWIDGALWSPANNVRITTANAIEIRDTTTSQILWHLSPARAWDSEPEHGDVIGQLEVRRQGGPSSLFISVRIPKSWIDLADFPIYIDPTIDDQVDTGTDDGYVKTDGYYNDSTVAYVGRTPQVTAGRIWALFGGISGLSGEDIDVSYFEPRINTLKGSACKTNIYAEYGASPAYPTTQADYDGRTTTTAYVAWDDNTSVAVFVQSPSINTIIQELADNYDPSTILILWKDDGSGNNNYLLMSCYEQASSFAAKLHIEHSTPSSPGGASTKIYQYRRRR